MKERINIAAFKKPLEGSDIKGNRDFLMQLKEDRRFIIREIHQPIAEAATLRGLYDDLRDFGISAPMRFIIAEKNEESLKYHESIEDTEGRKTIYAITDKITPADLNDKTAQEQFGKDIVDLYSKIIDYYLAKLESGKAYLTDIGGWDQFVYGKREGDEQNHMYLVDAGGEHSYRPNSLLMLLETRLLSEINNVDRQYDGSSGRLSKRADALWKKTRSKIV